MYHVGQIRKKLENISSAFERRFSKGYNNEVGMKFTSRLLYIKILLVPTGLFFIAQLFISKSVIEISNLSWKGIVLGLAVHQIAVLCLILRSMQAMKIFSIDLGFKDVHNIYLQGMFYFFFVPMSLGLDIVRAAKVKFCLPEVSIRSILYFSILDRLVGLISALLTVLLLLPTVNLMPKTGIISEIPASSKLVILLISIAITVFVVVVICKFFNSHQNYGKLLKRSFFMIFFGISSQIIFGLGVYLIASELKILVDLQSTVLAISLSFIFMALPVSFLGVTGAEIFGVFGFSLIGLGIHDAAVLLTISYLFRLFLAVQGGFLELFFSKKQLSNLNRLQD